MQQLEGALWRAAVSLRALKAFPVLFAGFSNERTMELTLYVCVGVFDRAVADAVSFMCFSILTGSRMPLGRKTDRAQAACTASGCASEGLLTGWFVKQQLSATTSSPH